MLAKIGDSGGSLISFDNPQNLRSVRLCGIHVAQSDDIAAGQQLESIINSAKSNYDINIVPIFRP
ncbi:2149_t:CDS:1, partial [Racocetra persica]